METERHALAPMLMRELFQTETSAERHPRVEAERLGDTPPARAMLAVSSHAERVLRELPSIAEACNLPNSDGGKLVGLSFSLQREKLADMLLNIEKSYRGTVLGMRHGVDLVELLRNVARVEGHPSLQSFCERWLDERKPLVEQCANELRWFAEHPERASESITRTAIERSAKALKSGYARIDGKLRGMLGRDN